MTDHLPLSVKHKGKLVTTIAGKGGFYFNFDLRVTNKKKHIIHTGEFIAREDSGCTKFVLSWDLYLLCGEPRTELAIGNGFNTVINHLKLATDEVQFHYKIHDIDMDWQIFTPVFLTAPDPEAVNDLAHLSTWGWQPQAALLKQNIGTVSVGLEKYIVGSAEAGADVMNRLLKYVDRI